MSDKTCGDFHSAKSDLESSLIAFNEAAKKDDRHVRDEFMDVMYDALGQGFIDQVRDGD